MRVRGDRLLQLGHEKLAIIVQESVKRLEDVRRCEVELVEDDPVPAANRLQARPPGTRVALFADRGKRRAKTTTSERDAVIRIDAKIERGNRNYAGQRDESDVPATARAV